MIFCDRGVDIRHFHHKSNMSNIIHFNNPCSVEHQSCDQNVKSVTHGHKRTETRRILYVEMFTEHIDASGKYRKNGFIDNHSQDNVVFLKIRELKSEEFLLFCFQNTQIQKTNLSFVPRSN